MSIVVTNTKVLEQCSQRISALQTKIPPNTVIDLDGKPYTVAQLVAIFQGDLDARAELLAARGHAKTALVARRTAEQSRLVIEPLLRSWVLLKYGPDSEEAHAFAYTRVNRRAPSVQTKAHAQALAKATRAARGTKGKRQKEKIKGTVDVPEAPAHTPPANPTG